MIETNLSISVSKSNNTVSISPMTETN